MQCQVKQERSLCDTLQHTARQHTATHVLKGNQNWVVRGVRGGHTALSELVNLV